MQTKDNAKIPLYTLRNKNMPVHLGVRWTGDNFLEARHALLSCPGIRLGDVRQTGGILHVHQNELRSDEAAMAGADYHLPPGGWLVWQRGTIWTRPADDATVRETFPAIEEGDTEKTKEQIAEDHRRNARFISKLQALMNEHPDLPIEWIHSAEDDCECEGGYLYSSVPYQVSVETISRGWRSHILVKGETEEEPDFEWYDAIVVRM